MLKKILSLLIILSIILVGIFQKDSFLQVVEQGGFLSILVSIVLVMICVFFPIVPFQLLAGLIGAVFGMAQGVIITLSGTIIGTCLMFILIRYSFRESAQAKLEKYPKVKEYEAFFEKNSFTAVLLTRLIPIIPSPVVNIICGLSNIKLITFITASAIGKLPNIIVLTVAGANFSNNKWLSFGIYGIYLIIILLINYKWISKKIEKETMDNASNTTT